MKSPLYLVPALVMIAACSGGSHNPFDALKNNPNVNKSAWYNSAAQVCSTSTDPVPGCDFHWTGKKVELNADPAFGGTNFQVYGGGDDNNDRVRLPNGLTVNAADLVNSPATYNGWTFSFAGWDQNDGHALMHITSPSGLVYRCDMNGQAINFLASSSPAGRNILGSEADQEQASTRVMQQGLKAKYQLSDEVSLDAAKLIAEDIKRPSNRGYSEAELTSMTERMYGVNLGKVKAAYALFRAGKVEESKTMKNELVSQAASKWKTTPENMEKILTDFYGDVVNK